MRYLSTRNRDLSVSSAEAICRGLSREGGLLTPQAIPRMEPGFLEGLLPLDYPRRCAAVMALYLTDFDREELCAFAERAYGPGHFDGPPAPLRELGGDTWCLELWHGPTAAFKDMALQMLPRLLSAALKKTGETRTACILAATSGDTGKAAMEGFADVPQTKIQVFYPSGGVSPVQELQMVTQTGENVDVRGVEGNFDDAQAGVKAVFSDEALARTLSDRGYFLTSANSINWGRILPQAVYYISAYCDLVSAGSLAPGERVNFCVPTGNFGNILAAFYAREMGLPVGRLLCASNDNHVLTDFLKTGVYDRHRPFYQTISPSMDILISSNLERLLFHGSGGDADAVKGYMRALSQTGRYQVEGDLLPRIQELFYGGFSTQEETFQTIARYYREQGYLMDPHTAVAAGVLEAYRRETGDGTKAVFLSTASAYKFCLPVLRALGKKPEEGLSQLAQLNALTGVPVPRHLGELAERPRRFSGTVNKDELARAVLDFLR